MLGKSFWFRSIIVPILALSMLMVTGCSGCREEEPSKDDPKAKTLKLKADFENRLPVLLPAVFPVKPKEKDEDETEDTLAEQAKREAMILEALRSNRAKLGHWSTAYFEVIANNFNSNGELSTVSVSGSGLARPVPVKYTDYFIETNRPASLAKGEWKSLEASIYLPRREDAKSVRVNYELKNSTTGLTMLSQIQDTLLMKPYSHHIVVLTNRSQAFNYIKLMNSVRKIDSYDFSSEGESLRPFYEVVSTKPEDPVPLPRQSLNWTTIAYVIWDDFTPDQLDTDQQTALLDWIHHGGQLIMSGPSCLDKVRGSFLDDYLPGEFASTFDITNKEVETLNENWAVPVRLNPNDKRTLNISPASPLLGVKMNPHPDANYIESTGEMVLERRVGRGRIAITAFPLDVQQVRKWRSFESFFNGCLLRKPARTFFELPDSTESFRYDGNEASIFDPLLGSTVRYLSRDLRDGGTPREHAYKISVENDNNFYGVPTAVSIEEQQLQPGKEINRDQSDIWHYGGYTDDMQSGVAGWSDENAVSVAARETLKNAAGILPPSSKFVLKMLVGYLLVLVPLNWILFRLMGKVEWAWIAAPIIAIIGAITVVKMASLDIGFVRSNTQIGLVEIYEGYPRAHVAEYSALYTSLSTRYDVELDNPSAQTLPFAPKIGKRFKPKETASGVTLNRSRENRLEGFQVQSNTTGMLHSEYTLDLKGPVRLEQDDNGDYFVANDSKLDLDSAGIIYRDDEGKYFACKIGLIASKSKTDALQFGETAKAKLADKWLGSSMFESQHRAAKKIWVDKVGAITDRTTVSQLSEIQELQEDWSTLQRLLLNRRQNTNLDLLWDEEIDFEEFETILSQVSRTGTINVGRMFDMIVDNLELELGEMRLIAQTNQKLGDAEFVPASTQTDRQTLIVVHLKKGELPLARRDSNSIADLKNSYRTKQTDE